MRGTLLISRQAGRKPERRKAGSPLVVLLALVASLGPLPVAAQVPDFDHPGGEPDPEWQHPRTPWGDPDLQGTWPLQHLITTPFQRPAQYGDRLHFTEEETEELRAQVQARNERYYEEDSSDRIGMGHWAEESDMPTQTSLIVDPPDGSFPPLTERGRELSASLGSSWGNQHWDHYRDFDGWDRCISRGLPMSMFPYQYNNGVQIVQAPGHVVINQEMIHEARIVPLDGRPLPHEGVKQYLGVARGHWEGNTLVIETSNFNGKLSMTNAGGALREYPSGEHATSTELRVIERLERVSDDQINYSITVIDPVTQTRPWTAAFPWRRDDGYQFFEYACHEDNTAVRNFIETSRFERARGNQQE